jgi:hypothetical protein
LPDFSTCQFTKITIDKTIVAMMGSYSVSGLTRDVIDITTFGETIKRFGKGLLDCGEISFNGLYDPADTLGQRILEDACESKRILTSGDLRVFINNDYYLTVASPGTMFLTQAKSLGMNSNGMAVTAFSAKLSANGAGVGHRGMTPKLIVPSESMSASPSLSPSASSSPSESPSLSPSPVIETLTRETGANSDTCRWEPGWGNFYSNQLLFGYDGSISTFHSAIRFPMITIPNGATIVSARIYFVSAATSGGPHDPPWTISIYGNYIDDAVAPTSHYQGDALVKTTAKVSWPPSAGTINGRWELNGSYNTGTYDLSGIVQEIINQVEWVNGNAILFKIQDVVGATYWDNSYWNPYPHSYATRPYIIIQYYV